MNHRAIVTAVALLLACEPRPLVAPAPLVEEAPSVVIAPAEAASTSAAAPIATAPPIDSAPSVSATPSVSAAPAISAAPADAGPPEDPGPVVLTLQEWNLSRAAHTTIRITAKGYAFFDLPRGKKYQGKVTPDGLEAFRIALVKANLCGGKFATNVQWHLDVDSKLSAVRCSVSMSETRGVKSPRVQAIKSAFHDLKENACQGPCP
jgi:hypothetical protein